MNDIKCATPISGAHHVNRKNLALVAEAGIERVEIHLAEPHFPYHDPQAVAEAAEALAATGVECRSVHLAFENDYDISATDPAVRAATLEDMIEALSVARALNAEIAVVHGNDELVAAGRRQERIGLLREGLAGLSDAARESGVKIALELLPRDCLGNTSEELLHIVEGFPAGGIGFCFDVNHANFREDPAEAILALSGRILSYHVSDNDGVDERHWFPFEGVIDWQSVMAAIRKTGYDGQFVFETKGSLHGDGEREGDILVT